MLCLRKHVPESARKYKRNVLMPPLGILGGGGVNYMITEVWCCAGKED